MLSRIVNMRSLVAIVLIFLLAGPISVVPDSFTHNGRTFHFNTCACGQVGPQRSKRATGKVIDVADVSLDNALSDYNEFGLNFKVNLNLSRLDNQDENEMGNEYDAYAEYFNRNFQYDQQLVEDIVTRAPKKSGPIAARTMRERTAKSAPQKAPQRNFRSEKKFRSLEGATKAPPATETTTMNSTDQATYNNMVVVGGIVAETGEVPWQVLIENMNNGEICGGSILNPRFILTAAHCIDSFENAPQTFKEPFPNNILILLEQPELCQKGNVILPSGTRRVLRTFKHHLYDKAYGRKKEPIYDFALVMVSKSMYPFTRQMQPICLPPVDLWDNYFINVPVKVSGYGRIEGKLDESRDQTACSLMTGNLKIVHPRDPSCESLSSYPQIQMCAFHPETDACQGDSGGPLTFQSGTTFYQIGVVSYGNKDCSRKDLGTVYGRLTKVLPWVIAMIQGGECGVNPIYDKK